MFSTPISFDSTQPLDLHRSLADLASRLFPSSSAQHIQSLLHKVLMSAHNFTVVGANNENSAELIVCLASALKAAHPHTATVWS